VSILEAIILGLVQGLTEFLPVSSSGHLELGKAILDVKNADNLTFSVIVHGATVLSILVVFRKDILALIRGLFAFKWNDETKFVSLLLVSAIPTAIVGLLFEEQIEALFSGKILLVGCMLLITALLLFTTRYAPKQKKEIGFFEAIIVGIAQTIAILPGISRSGATISTSLLLGIDREKATRFSFLMVLIPIIGATFLKTLDLFENPTALQSEGMPMLAGFIAAFVSGLLACSWMLRLVKKGKIYYFAIYVALAGIVAIIAGLLY